MGRLLEPSANVHDIWRTEGAQIVQRVNQYDHIIQAAGAHWREEMARDLSSIKAEDWFPDEARLSLEQAGDAVLVRMEYVSSFTGKASTMTWRLEPVGGTWRIADWQQAGQWLP